MKITTKFAIAIVLGLFCVLSLQAIAHVRDVKRLQEREIRDDVRILARAISVAAAAIARVGGEEPARNYIESASERREQTTISFSDDETTALTVRTELGADTKWSVVALAPVAAPLHGTISIKRTLPGEREHFRDLLLTQAITTVAAVTLSSLIIVVLGWLLIGRPLSVLSDVTSKIANGDLNARTRLTGRDEVGRLGRDLDAMAEQLTSAAAEVTRERRARTNALERLRHVDRLATLGRLASVMAHELGTPLNVIQGRAALLEEEPLSADGVAHVEVISDQTRRMTSMIQENLNLARRRPPRRERELVSSLLTRAHALFGPLADERDVSLDLTEPQRDVPLSIDPDRMLQVLANLIMNAVQASRAGDSVSISSTRELVDDPPDHFVSPGPFVRIDVVDAGPGISRDELKTIFSEFFSTKQGEGTGLGLPVARDIVREHDGFIHVADVSPRGARFSVYLPEAEAEAPPSSAEKEETPARDTDKTKAR